jgi:hypothetical protein
MQDLCDAVLECSLPLVQAGLEAGMSPNVLKTYTGEGGHKKGGDFAPVRDGGEAVSIPLLHLALFRLYHDSINRDMGVEQNIGKQVLRALIAAGASPVALAPLCRFKMDRRYSHQGWVHAHATNALQFALLLKSVGSNDDHITVQRNMEAAIVALTKVTTFTSSGIPHGIEDPQILRQMLLDNRFSDVVLQCPGEAEPLLAHRAVLACASVTITNYYLP